MPNVMRGGLLRDAETGALMIALAQGPGPAFGASLGAPVTHVPDPTTTVAMTTDVDVPSGARAVVAVSWYGAGVTAALTGGSLTWTKVVQVDGAVDSSRHLALFVPTASGPASNTVLTATFSAGAYGRAIFGAYFNGVGSTDATSKSTASSTGSGLFTWNTGAAATAAAHEAVVGAVWLDGGVGSNAPAANVTEALDFNDGAACSWLLGYRIVSATGSYSIGGSLSYADVGGSTEELLAALVTLKA